MNTHANQPYVKPLALSLQSGMDAGEIREQDPALLLFLLYTAGVCSLTEASVLNAVVGKDKSQASIRRRDARGRRVRVERAPARPALEHTLTDPRCGGPPRTSGAPRRSLMPGLRR